MWNPVPGCQDAQERMAIVANKEDGWSTTPLMVVPLPFGGRRCYTRPHNVTLVPGQRRKLPCCGERGVHMSRQRR